MASAELAAVLRAKNEAETEVESFRNGISGVEQSFLGITPAASSAGIAIGATVGVMVGLSKAAYDLGASFDDAFDAILLKTGATGQALQDLQSDFQAVFANVPQSAAEVATALSLVHARTDQTGEGLQALTQDILTFSRLTGTDSVENIRAFSRAFGDWGISPDEMSAALDKFFVASQKAGTSGAELARTITQFGAPLRQLGIDFNEALSLATKWEKEGVNVETVLGTMRIALAKLSETGLDPSETFGRLLNTIRDMEDPIEATSLAMEIFGKRGGADMAAAIREGRFSIDEYVTALENSRGSVRDAAEATDDAKQDMERAWNELKTSAAPVVTEVFNALNEILKSAVPLIKDFARELRNVAEDFKAMKEGKITWQDVAAARMGVTPADDPGGKRTDLSGVKVNRPPGFPTVEDETPPPPSVTTPTSSGLTPEELAALRRNNDAEREAAREAARIKREQEREAQAAIREAERIMKEQQRQAEREAEQEARRINTIRELGQRRADAINEATQVAQEAILRANERAEEQRELAEAQFARERDLAEKRQKLQDDVRAAAEAERDRQADVRRGVSDTRESEDIERRRAREDADLLDRQAARTRQTAEVDRQAQEKINAARFAGDSRAVTAAQLAAQRAKEARDAAVTDEQAQLERRRQREDEDRDIRRQRQAEDLEQQKQDAADLARVIAEASKPLEAFNQKILEDSLAEKIAGYFAARDALISAANERLDTSIERAESQFDQGVRRANEAGQSQQTILNQTINNYNYGVQGEDAVQQLLEDAGDEAEALARSLG